MGKANGNGYVLRNGNGNGTTTPFDRACSRWEKVIIIFITGVVLTLAAFLSRQIFCNTTAIASHETAIKACADADAAIWDDVKHIRTQVDDIYKYLITGNTAKKE